MAPAAAGEAYSGLITTTATTNWKLLALPWLLDEETTFSPETLIGMPFSLPSKVPSVCFDAKHNFTKFPSFGNCLREIMLIMQQLQTDDRLHEQLFAWLHLMPIILLRVPTQSLGSSDSEEMHSPLGRPMGNTIQRCCQE